MRNVIIIYLVLFILLPALKAGTVPYYNPVSNALIKTIIKVESSGNPKAISSEGAWGFMSMASWQSNRMLQGSSGRERKP